MTTKKAQLLAEAADFVCFYDPAVKLWTIYHADLFTPAKYFTARVIKGLSEERFSEIFLSIPDMAGLYE